MAEYLRGGFLTYRRKATVLMRQLACRVKTISVTHEAAAARVGCGGGAAVMYGDF